MSKAVASLEYNIPEPRIQSGSVDDLDIHLDASKVCHELLEVQLAIAVRVRNAQEILDLVAGASLPQSVHELAPAHQAVPVAVEARKCPSEGTLLAALSVQHGDGKKFAVLDLVVAVCVQAFKQGHCLLRALKDKLVF